MATRIRISTTFDCTTTGVTGHYKSVHSSFFDNANQTIDSLESWTRSRNQQRNYETLLQIISLYTQPEDITESREHNGTWSFEFTTEFDGIFSNETHNLGLLKNAANGVPVLDKINTDQLCTIVIIPDVNVFFEEIEINNL
jgi:hypothetical protein